MPRAGRAIRRITITEPWDAADNERRFMEALAETSTEMRAELEKLAVDVDEMPVGPNVVNVDKFERRDGDRGA
jgi:hypothetical protein